MSLRIRSLTVLLGASAALFGGALASAREPIARTATTCSVGTGSGYGYTYLTSLSVHGLGCANGRHVVKHHGSGSGWSCHKTRLSTSPTQYLERERCTKGSRSVKWTYSQNT
jgi:hypothetical protein